MSEPIQVTGPTGIWACKIGETDKQLPMGCDWPMREAVRRAYREITGEEAHFIFSGWSAELTETERQVVDGDRKQEAHA